MSFKVESNCCPLRLEQGASIFVYACSIEPPSDVKTAKKVLGKCWAEVKKELSDSVVPEDPHFLLAPALWGRKDDLRLTPKEGGEGTVLVIKFHEKFCADQVNSGDCPHVEVLFKFLVKNLMTNKSDDSVGGRYYRLEPESAIECEPGEGDHAAWRFYPSFQATYGELQRTGPVLHLDATSRAVQEVTVTDIMKNLCESRKVGPFLEWSSAAVRALWEEKLVGATVMTTYVNRPYKIRSVRFDKNINEKFMQRGGKGELHETTIGRYLEDCYSIRPEQIKVDGQPLLEAVPQRRGETCFLVPECCWLVGMGDEVPQESKKQEQNRKEKISAKSRHTSMTERVKMLTASGKKNKGERLLQDWKVSVRPPIQVEGRALEPVQVSFVDRKDPSDDSQPFTISDGSFMTQVKQGFPHKVDIENWVLLYPEDQKLNMIEAWQESWASVAEAGFGIVVKPPVKATFRNKEGIKEALEKNVTPQTQLVMMLSSKDADTYNYFKKLVCTTFPVASQVLRLDTIRLQKKKAIAIYMRNITPQVANKIDRPSWHISSSAAENGLFKEPTMAIGIDVFVTPEGEYSLAFAASMGAACSDFYSVGCPLPARKRREAIFEKLQEYLRDACSSFSKRHDGALPSNIMVWRGNTDQEDWPALMDSEVGALRALIRQISDIAKGSSQDSRSYDPALTYVAVARQTPMRLFQLDGSEGVCNLKPGTVVDSADVLPRPHPGFYLVSHAVGMGLVEPAHCTLLAHDFDRVSLETIVNTTYRLSHLYYNVHGGIRLPVPLQNARKLANLIGTAIKEEPHKRLRHTLFYL